MGCELLLSSAQLPAKVHYAVLDPPSGHRMISLCGARMQDVGKPKAEVAAARIKERIPGVTVTPHVCRIEEKPVEFYGEFILVVLGLDSIEARRYMNSVMCSFLGRCQR